MTPTANQFILHAKSYLGVTQGSQRHIDLIAQYNSVSPLPRGYAVKTTDDWCDIFVTVIGDKTGLSPRIGRECGVKSHVDIFKSLGIWLGRATPQRGDIVTYDWDRDGWPDHIGIVTGVYNNTIQTIEGNTSGRRVAEQHYHAQAPFIYGYARPSYDAEASPILSVVIKETAERWATGETIDDWVKGRQFAVMGHRQRGEHTEYLLLNQNIPIGWMSEENIIKKA